MSDQRGVLVAGSIAQDFVDSPVGRLEGELGGSATYAALAARHFGPVAVVGCVGADRATELRGVLHFADLERLSVTQAPTYTWRSRRASPEADAETLERFPGGYDGYRPAPGNRAAPVSIVFLGSCDPLVQLAVADDAPRGSLVAGDTMDIFIRDQRSDVERMVSRCRLLFATELELELLAEARGVAAASTLVLDRFGLSVVVVKRGRDGAVLWTRDQQHRLPAYHGAVVDPTGAGDTLAGAMLGRLAELTSARQQSAPMSADALLDALQWGMVAASFAIAAPGLRGSIEADRPQLEARLREYREGLDRQRASAELEPGEPRQP